MALLNDFEKLVLRLDKFCIVSVMRAILVPLRLIRWVPVFLLRLAEGRLLLLVVSPRRDVSPRRCGSLSVGVLRRRRIVDWTAIFFSPKITLQKNHELL